MVEMFVLSDAVNMLPGSEFLITKTSIWFQEV